MPRYQVTKNEVVANGANRQRAKTEMLASRTFVFATSGHDLRHLMTQMARTDFLIKCLATQCCCVGSAYIECTLEHIRTKSANSKFTKIRKIFEFAKFAVSKVIASLIIARKAWAWRVTVSLLYQ